MGKHWGFIFFIGVGILLSAFLTSENGLARDINSDLSPEGYWQTIPDDDSSPSVIQIWLQEGEAFGKVVKIYSKPGRDPNPICDKCEGDLKDRPIIGMTILSHLTQDNERWTGGSILDPNKGKVYKCKIQVIDDGARLKVRGYIGFSLLGRTQYWIKVPNPL